MQPEFALLPQVAGGFAAAHVDPPWRFRSNSAAKPGRNAMRHYACLSPEKIASLPVGEIMAKDSFVFLWVPGPRIDLFGRASRPGWIVWGDQAARFDQLEAA
jgi:N6-adenosine-specific RNA methylase IME4